MSEWRNKPFGHTNPILYYNTPRPTDVHQKLTKIIYYLFFVEINKIIVCSLYYLTYLKAGLIHLYEYEKGSFETDLP